MRALGQMAPQLVEVQRLAGGVVHQDATKTAIGPNHRCATLLPRVALHTLLAKACAHGPQRIPDHARVEDGPQAAAHVERGKCPAVWIAQDRQAAAKLLRKRGCLGRLRWAHEDHADVARGKLRFVVAHLRDPLAAEQSTKVPYEHCHERSILQEPAQRGGAAIRGEQRCVQQLCGVVAHTGIVPLRKCAARRTASE